MRSANARMPALYVEFIDGVGVMVDLGERQFLAQLVALPAVGRDVDRLRIEERLIQLVQLLLDGTHPPLLFRRPLFRFSPTLLPHAEDSILDQPHVAWRRLQDFQLVDERAFQRRLAHVHRAALTLTVVIRVLAVPALRPAAGERPAARLAAHEAAQREVRVIALSRTGHDDAAIENSLSAIERSLVDQRLEVAAGGHPTVRALTPAQPNR